MRWKTCGDGGGINEDEIPSMPADVPKELEDFTAHDSFHCDELALQCNLLPENTISRCQEVRGIKKNKPWIPVFLVTNADGSEKLDPIVNCRAKTAQEFRDAKINPNNLPVVYHYNKKALMLSGIIWYEYLTKLNQQMAAQNRYIALITDNCPSHPPPENPPKDYN